ncbi:MAG: flagellar FliJ family protein [Alphaproteobacteria bacterium]|nr:flagellar FliJ family protein [Alphaproteobacteria bacterium]
MAKLDSLVRVRKHNVEQQQKALAVLYQRSEALKAERDSLETQLAIESEKSLNLPPDMLGYYGAYAKKTRKEIDYIDNKRAKLEKQIEMAQERLRDAYAEQKKVEIINQRRKDAERAKQEAKESKELDEIAIDGFRRKTEN